VKITRTLMFLANLARVIPVNPIMLVDVTHHAAEHDIASAAIERPEAAGAPAGQVAEASLFKGLRTAKS
jgi:hypothetical protein